MKYLFSILLISLLSSLYGKSVDALTDSKIQGRLNIVNGASSECVMHTFYAKSGWKKIEGEVGRNGIDGLYYKKKHGSIREVLVAESKWNRSKLGKSGKRKLVKQMSQEWILRTLNRLQYYKPLPEYTTIVTLVKNGHYRARLFKMTPVGKDKVAVSIYKIQNKGFKTFDTFLERRLRPMIMGKPKNSFERDLLQAYDSCRKSYLKRYFPMLNEYDVSILLKDNYLQKEDIKRVLFKK